jgi:hypothetical protein
MNAARRSPHGRRVKFPPGIFRRTARREKFPPGIFPRPDKAADP